jgi:hypothetical protein
MTDAAVLSGALAGGSEHTDCARPASGVSTFAASIASPAGSDAAASVSPEANAGELAMTVPADGDISASCCCD